MSHQRPFSTALLSLGLSLGVGCGDALPPADAAAEAPPLVLLVTFDTTRADHLSAYGYERETSPNLDALAAEGTLYERATSTASWTLPAHASLFTAKITRGHGARYDPDGPLQLTAGIDGPDRWDAYRARGLSSQETTLAERLQEAGFATAGIVAGPWMKRVFGLDEGFDHYDDANIDSVRGRLAEDLTGAAIEWLASVEDQPAFLFLNYYDPHSPFDAPPPYTHWFHEDGAPDDKSRASEIARYDAEIRYTDHHFGRLLESLRQTGRYENALIVVTADHGELLGEHGLWGHGSSLHEEEIHIPMIVKPRGPAREAVREPSRVSQVDVMPMILDDLELPLPDDGQGGVPPNARRPIVAEAYPLTTFGPTGHWRAWYEDGHKLLWNDRGNHKLFDLSADPREIRSLSRRDPARVAAMSKALDAYLEELPPPFPADAAEDIDAETQRALRALGYVE